MPQSQPQHALLQRQIGLPGAVMLGLGSIIGTGLFVALGLGAEVAGAMVLPAIALAAFVALCNALSSAQLAAAHPVAGGTYEYGYRYLSPRMGFTAGWLFLAAKSASAATAALGLAGYLLTLFKLENPAFRTPLAVLIIVLITLLVLNGIRRSNLVNTVLVTITIATLIFFIFSGLHIARQMTHRAIYTLIDFHDTSDPSHRLSSFFYATAIMFVAYTGYGRIATLSEEVHEPARTIPKAIIFTLAISAMLYLAVATVALMLTGSEGLASITHNSAAPLEIIARIFQLPGASVIMALGAVTAMSGVLLNLILGLSRIYLAMGRRGDMPSALAQLNDDRTSAVPGPAPAVLLTGGIVALIASLGSIAFAWSFSAFTVLIYYALTNFAALQLPYKNRLFSRLWSLLGLVACLALACFVPWRIWAIGLSLIVLGWCWHAIAQRNRKVAPDAV